MNKKPLYDNLKNSIVLAEMAGYSNASFCIKNGAGSSLAILGTYIIDPSEKIPYPEEFYFKSDKNAYYDYLEKNINIIKKTKIKLTHI